MGIMKKIKQQNRSFWRYLIIVCTLCLCAQSKVALAVEPFSFTPYIDLSSQEFNDKAWLSPLPNPSNKNALLLTSTEGKLYQTYNKKIEPVPVFDFITHLEDHKPLFFSAIALHPNFNLVDQVGSQTIYTAHIENFNADAKNDRLQDDNAETEYTHDAVIIEWQLNNANITGFKLEQVREVMRIATTSADIKINQLAFNPQLKSWDDEFGLLFIAIDYDQSLPITPLYSGAVLRINPEKFGSINYSIPQSNKFISNQEVSDEIVIFGAQQASLLSWTKHTKNSLIVSHNFNNKMLISILPMGSNLLLNPTLNSIYQDEKKTVPTTNQYYTGRELTRLRSKFIVLNQNEKNWTLASVALNQPLKTKAELTLSSNDFALKNKLELYTTHDNEILMWDKTKSIIYKLNANIVSSSAPIELTSEPGIVKETAPSSANNNKQVFYIVLGSIFAALVLLVLWLLRKRYKRLFSKTKTLLRSNYAKFKLNETSTEIAFLNRHKETVDKVVLIEDIYSSEIFLNEVSLNEVSTQQSHLIDNDLDKEIRKNFAKEHQYKMIDKKVRKIHIKILTKKGEEILVCNYLREGNQRLTRENYHTVIESTLDWQWFISTHLHPEQMPKRAPKLITKTPRSLKKVDVKANTKLSAQEKVKPAAQTKPILKTDVKPAIEAKPIAEKVENNLVNSLSQLVELKEKGFLTDEEFLIAKSDILTKNTK